MTDIEILEHVLGNLRVGVPAGEGLILEGKDSGAERLRDMGLFEGYTLAPRTHTVNGFIVPSPMGVKPSRGERYSIIDFTEADLLQVLPWRDDPADNRSFKRGLCFTTKEAAQQNALAMLGRDPSKGVYGV